MSILTWEQFLESKKMGKKEIEKEEEKLHKDLDGDNEEGESKEHKKKVFGFLAHKKNVKSNSDEEE